MLELAEAPLAVLLVAVVLRWYRRTRRRGGASLAFGDGGAGGTGGTGGAGGIGCVTGAVDVECDGAAGAAGALVEITWA